MASRKTSRTRWTSLKSVGGLVLFFFLPPTETTRCGVTKGPETDQKEEHKANPPNIEKLRKMSLCCPIELAFYCLCVLLSFHYFYHFYFISILLFLFLMFSFPCFISLFNCIVWFSLFSLYCILIFLLSHHLWSKNTLLLIVYFLFWLSKSCISCHIIVFLILL